MKWVFLLAVVMFAPALAVLLRSNPRFLRPTCFLLGLCIVLVGPTLWTAPIGWPLWPSPISGFQVSFVDAISVAILVSTPKVRLPWYVTAAFALYFATVAISILIGSVWMAAAFYAWQLVRTAILFVAIARVCAAEPRCQIAILAGMAMGIICEPAFVWMQHSQGLQRPGGTFGHSNFLGIVIDFVAPPALAALLGTRRWAWPGLTLLAAAVCLALGESRASMGMFALGVLLTLGISIVYRRSSRKMAFAGLTVLFMFAALPALIFAAGKRSEATLASSDAERTAMKAAAAMMIADHPFGVGANQYANVAIMSGYSARAGVAWNEGNRKAPVHNTYYLVTAEMGVIGLVAFLALIASVIALGVNTLRSHPSEEGGELVVGLLASMIILSVHIAFEFAFMEQNIHYLFAISVGIMAGIWARSKGPKSAIRPVMSATLARPAQA